MLYKALVRLYRPSKPASPDQWVNSLAIVDGFVVIDDDVKAPNPSVQLRPPIRWRL